MTDEPELEALKKAVLETIYAAEDKDDLPPEAGVSALIFVAARLFKGSIKQFSAKMSGYSQHLGDREAKDWRPTHAISAPSAQVVRDIIQLCAEFKGESLDMCGMCIVFARIIAKHCRMNRYTFMAIGAAFIQPEAQSLVMGTGDASAAAGILETFH